METGSAGRSEWCRGNVASRNRGEGLHCLTQHHLAHCFSPPLSSPGAGFEEDEELVVLEERSDTPSHQLGMLAADQALAFPSQRGQESAFTSALSCSHVQDQSGSSTGNVAKSQQVTKRGWKLAAGNVAGH